MPEIKSVGNMYTSAAVVIFVTLHWQLWMWHKIVAIAESNCSLPNLVFSIHLFIYYLLHQPQLIPYHLNA